MRNHLARRTLQGRSGRGGDPDRREAIRLHPEQADGQYNLGSLLLAEGRSDESVKLLREAVRLDANHPEALCNLGHALQAQGRFEGGARLLPTRTRSRHEARGSNYPSADWIAECEKMVAGDRLLSAVLKGEKHIEENSQRVTLAIVARLKGLPAASARFYAEAIAAEPAAAADPATSGLRYDAACAAAVAGSGNGMDDPPPDGAARAKLRLEALDWLNADLAAWSKIATDGPPKSRLTLTQSLRHWKTDSNLAGIRDETAVKALAGDEQKTCRALWAEVRLPAREDAG